MGQSAYIHLVDESKIEQLTLDDVKQELEHYINKTSKTGEQLGWDYAGAAFPYTIEERFEGKTRWIYLRGNDPTLYKHILIGVGTNRSTSADGEEKEEHYIQVTLPDDATHGDKSKANEFCKYLAGQIQAKLLLFNGRTMYYYPRKP